MFQTNTLEKIKTHILYTVTFLKKKNRNVYDVMKKNTVQPDRPQMTIWPMRIACSIPKATYAHSEYVILIALLLQQWLQERASILHCT